jgi:hypothetical protein
LGVLKKGKKMGQEKKILMNIIFKVVLKMIKNMDMGKSHLF